MVKKTESENLISAMLSETILALCRNTLSHRRKFSIEGLLGITLDDEEIFLVNIKETIAKGSVLHSSQGLANKSASEASFHGSDDFSGNLKKRKLKNSQDKDRDGDKSSSAKLEEAESIEPVQIKREKLDSDDESYIKREYSEGDDASFRSSSFNESLQSDYGITETPGSSHEMDMMLGHLPNLSYQVNSNLSSAGALLNMVSDSCALL